MRVLHGAGWAVALLALCACGQGPDATPSAGEPSKAAHAPGPDEPTAGAAPSAAIPHVSEAPTPATSAFSADLAGAWAGDLESCNSGEAVSFFADGTYGMEGEGGRWRLEGDRLKLTGISQFELGGAGEVAVPDRTLTVTQLTDHSMAWRADDGFEASFARCPG